MTVVCDTAFLVDVARRHKAASTLLDRLAADGVAFLIPPFVVAEFLAGAADPETAFEDLRAAGELLPFEPEQARTAGNLARQRLAAGTFPGWSDICIEAFAIHHGAKVVTRNRRHFDPAHVLAY